MQSEGIVLEACCMGGFPDQFDPVVSKSSDQGSFPLAGVWADCLSLSITKRINTAADESGSQRRAGPRRNSSTWGAR